MSDWTFTAAEPLLVWGSGAIGGCLGSAFAATGQPVVFVDRVEEHVRAIRADGLTVEGPVRSLRVAAPAFTPAELSGVFRLVFLAVKAQDTEAAARELLPHLAPDGVVVSAQNGLNEPVIARATGPARVMGCFLNFGADYLSPGLIHYGNRGAVVNGETDGSVGARAKCVHGLLRRFDEDAVLTGNIWGYLWSKLAYGAMLYATALTDAPIWQCLGHRDHMPLFIALGREIIAVARAQGIRPEAFNGFDPAAFNPEASLPEAVACMEALSAFNSTSTKTHSGIWRDLAVRGRKTEVDAQLTPILEAARAHGLPARLTDELIRLVHQCEDGLPRGWSNLDALAGAMPRPER